MWHTVISFLIFTFVVVSLSFGQTPSDSPIPARKTRKIDNFGSSLKRYEQREKENSQPSRYGIELSDDAAITVKSDLVGNDVLVTDQKGNIVDGLKKEDFIVAEDGEPETVEIFSSGETTSNPRSIVLIIGCHAEQAFTFKSSIEAAKRLVERLDTNDRMAIVTDDVKVAADFSEDKSALKKELDVLQKKGVKRGSGMQFDTLLAVLNEMFFNEDRRPIVIFQGDGNEIIWLKNSSFGKYRSFLKDRLPALAPGERDFGFDDVTNAVEKSGAIIYSIIPSVRFLGFSNEERLARAKISLERNFGVLFNLNPNSDSRIRELIRDLAPSEAEIATAGQTAMYSIAELSGGKAAFIEKPEDPDNVYSSVFDSISKRYFIGYYPTNQNRDGKRREVKIIVKGHPEYMVYSRSGYIPR